MKIYYTELLKDTRRDLPKAVPAVINTAKRAFEPFEKYLQNSIKSFEKKEIGAYWKKIEGDNTAKLKLNGFLYEYTFITTIKVNQSKNLYRIKGHIQYLDYEEPIRIRVGKDKYSIPITSLDYEAKLISIEALKGQIPTRALWGMEDIELEPIWQIFTTNTYIYDENNNEYKILKVLEEDRLEIQGDIKPNSILYYDNKTIDFSITNTNKLEASGIQIIEEKKEINYIFSKQRIQGLTPFNEDKIAAFIDWENIILDNKNISLEREYCTGLSINLPDQTLLNKIVVCKGLSFSIEKDKEPQKWIQLIEKEEDSDSDEFSNLSPLRYFFDDGVDIISRFNNREEKYQISKALESENKLVLKLNGRETYPIEKTLELKYNTYALEMQKKAMISLRRRPIQEHRILIDLFNDVEYTRWKQVNNIAKIEEWYVIKDDKRSGSQEQREFINKAINTPDFAILEGPPGSGKTTVILELICQLIKQGKRILLCGSTHVAIDNVLERLSAKHSNQDKNLLEQFLILPLRIGDERRVSEEVKHFQIDNITAENNIDKNLLVDAANLVCGTTIGILQHPLFKEKNSNREPIVPEFDYLIIDESSKTTFQEFLVPALYAKRWVLVGDVMQLAPFTEREQVVSNIDSILEDEPLKMAIFYLHKIQELFSNKIEYKEDNKYILPMPSSSIEALYKELLSGRKEQYQDIHIAIIDNNLEGNSSIYYNLKQISIHNQYCNKLELVAEDFIIIDEALLDELLDDLPETHALLRYNFWLNSTHAFKHNVLEVKNKFSYFSRGREYNLSYDIIKEFNAYFSDKTWAEEIAWRIDREHQLRLVEKNNATKSYQRVIEELMPKSEDKQPKSKDAQQILEEINEVAAMSFPSILESLVQGIKGRKSKIRTTLTEGFTPEDLISRHTTLKYQHRMHPHISEFPRRQFYKTKDALHDLEKPIPIAEKRKWDYDKYNGKHAIWVNVKGKTNRNYNEEEVREMMRQLKDFIAYAKNNPQPEGNQNWSIACLTFYKKQEDKMREALRQFTGKMNAFSSFDISNTTYKINIKLYVVDKFQGQEADVVFLSMVQTARDGFLDNPNRLNVALTRAKFQLVVLGDAHYFTQKSKSKDLKDLAFSMHKI